MTGTSLLNDRPSVAMKSVQRPDSASGAIEVERLTKSYKSSRALDDVSLSVRPGEFMTLLGPSGSGKTTLLMTLAGFVRPDSGRVRLGGRDITDLPAHLRGVGMMFQSYALFPHMTVAENIGYPLRLRRVPRAKITDRVQQMLHLVRLDQLGGRQITELSGGQRQRVALARSVIFEPRVLLMDEPLSALDKNLRAAMQQEIRAFHDRLGVTTLCVTHDQHEALTMSDRVVVMDHGRIVQVGTPREIYETPRTTFVGRFVGDSSLLPLERSVQQLHLFGRPLVTASQHADDGVPLELLIRPERLKVAPPGGAPANRLKGAFRSKVYQGESVVVNLVSEGGQDLLMKLSASDPWLSRSIAAGDDVDLYVAASDAIVVAADRA